MYYLIWLTGQGDTHVKVVDQQTWDWITDTHRDVACPAAVIERKRQIEGENFDEFYETPGSYINDRALWAPAIVIDGHEFDDYTDGPGAAEAMSDWKKQLKIKQFTDTFEGCIY